MENDRSGVGPTAHDIGGLTAQDLAVLALTVRFVRQHLGDPPNRELLERVEGKLRALIQHFPVSCP